jgi:hypothetical protein
MRVGSYVRIDGMFHDDDWEEGIILEVDELGALVTITRIGTPRTFDGLYTYWTPLARMEILSE